MVYLHPAMQCSTQKNMAQQQLFNNIKMPFGTDFLVYNLIHNVTLLKCMRKALYYTKKLSGHFPSVTIFIRPWWKKNNVM